MSENGVRRAAQTIGELDVHISFLQRDLQAVGQRLDQMATKADIEALTVKMNDFATKEELQLLEEKVIENSPGTVIHSITKFALAIVAVSGAIGAVIALLRWVRPDSI